MHLVRKHVCCFVLLYATGPAYALHMRGIAALSRPSASVLGLQQRWCHPSKISERVSDPRMLVQHFIDDKVEKCPLPAGAFKRDERDSLFDMIDALIIPKQEFAAFAMEAQKKAGEEFDLVLQKHLTPEQAYTYKANVDFRHSSKYHDWNEKSKQQYFNDFKKMQNDWFKPKQLKDALAAEKRYLISQAVYTYLYVHASGYPVPITFYF